MDPACVGCRVANGPREFRESLVVSDSAQEGPLLAALMTSTKLEGTNCFVRLGRGPAE